MDWLIDMEETSILLGAFLRVIHPELYQTSLEAMLNLRGLPDIDLALAPWGTVFNALSIIVNRQTPEHRDSQSRSQWYDLLTTFGTYREAFLQLPGLGLEVPYPSGTLVAFSGRMIRHAVPACEGDRVCLAYYMRDAVQERLGSRAADWMRISQLEGPGAFMERRVAEIWGADLGQEQLQGFAEERNNFIV